MSYSRWSNSIWYTYYNSSSLDNLIRDEQVFTICVVKSFTYKELKLDIEACLKEAAFCYQKVYNGITMNEPIIDPALYPTLEEIEELRSYMLEFIYDVENDKELV